MEMKSEIRRLKKNTKRMWTKVGRGARRKKSRTQGKTREKAKRKGGREGKERITKRK